jgi:DNA processing protein
MRRDSIPLLQLMQTKGVGPRSVARVLDLLEQDSLSLRDFVDLPVEDMAERFRLREDQARSIQANEGPAERTAEMLDSNHIRTVLRPTAAYPERLKAVLGEQAPPVLFVAGAADLLHRRGVGFCGARDASEEALRCADQVARALAQYDLLVVSGHAAGVDETAHRAAMEVGGYTALVLPEGILRFRARSSIAELLTDDNAVIVSEFSPNLSWSVANAMQRNRTICGLVHALIVIEAGTSGGTWEAGQAALRLGLPLFVLDYPDPAPSGKGNPLLLKKGGRPLPCRPGEPPDLTGLLQALDLPMTNAKTVQPTLFDDLV